MMYGSDFVTHSYLVFSIHISYLVYKYKDIKKHICSSFHCINN